MVDEIVQAASSLVRRIEWKPLLESMFYPILIVDRNGRIAMVNTLAVEILNYPDELLMGHLVEEFMPERFRERHIQHRTRYFEAPSRRAMGSGLDLALLTRDGIEVRVDLGLAPLRVQEGTFVSITIQRKF